MIILNPDYIHIFITNKIKSKLLCFIKHDSQNTIFTLSSPGKEKSQFKSTEKLLLRQTYPFLRDSQLRLEDFKKLTQILCREIAATLETARRGFLTKLQRETSSRFPNFVILRERRMTDGCHTLHPNFRAVWGEPPGRGPRQMFASSWK